MLEEQTTLSILRKTKQIFKINQSINPGLRREGIFLEKGQREGQSQEKDNLAPMGECD